MGPLTRARPRATTPRAVVGVLLAAILLGAACGGQTPPPPAPVPGAGTPGAATPAAGVPVAVAPATQGAIRAVLSYSGNVQAVQQTNLAPKTAGRIERILVEVGDAVRAGQPLVQLDQGSLQASVQQAEANLRSAQARVSQIQAGARPEDVETARAQLEAQRARLAGMQAGGRAEDVGAARAAVASALARLDQARNAVKPADVGTAEQNVKAAQGAFDNAVSALNKLKTPSEAELTQTKVAVQKAHAALQQAQAAYDRIGWRPDAAGRPESLQLQQATLDYQNALAGLELKTQPRQSDLDAAEKQVQTARAQLDAAQMRLDQLRAGPAPEDVRLAEAGVQQAEQNLAKAQQPNSPTDIQQQRQAVVQAEQSLALRSNPYTPADVEAAQATLAQAQAQLTQARNSALEGAIVAPYDGVVTARPLSEGSLVGAGTVAITVASTDVEVPINVEEVRVNDIQPGQAAALSSPGLGGLTLPARVASVAPTADQRTHTFAVKVRPDPQDRRVRAGMFANVQIVTAERPSAILVPREAVVTRDGKPVVFAVVDGRARLIDLSGGLATDQLQEAPTGVKPGDQIVVQGQATLGDGDPVRASPAPRSGLAPGSAAT